MNDKAQNVVSSAAKWNNKNDIRFHMQRAHNSKHLWPRPPTSLAQPRKLATKTTQTRLINVAHLKGFSLRFRLRLLFLFFSFLRIINVQCSKIRPPCPLSLAPPMTARLLCECQKQWQQRRKQFEVENQKRAKLNDFYLYFCRLTYANELAAPCYIQPPSGNVYGIMCGTGTGVGVGMETGTATPTGRVAWLAGCLHDLFTHGVRVFIKL